MVGTKAPAEQGTLTVLAAAGADLRERAMPVFDAVGSRTVWVDAPRGGTRLKLVANTWVLALTEGVAESIGMLHDALRRAGNAAPRIGVCGLNPHNGDNGNFGREEIDIIAPAIADAMREGVAEFAGPLSADTVFVPEHVRRYDAVVAMPGRLTGTTTRTSPPTTPQPSIQAASSISIGTERKKPIMSHVQNGMVKVG